MKLSVIIVNYNVEFFLEQCLNSCLKALKGIDGEVFVVDNNSIDGSVQMVRDKFTSVQLIENKVNTGFSKANNQAMRIAKGEYILLLNPDTIVEEETFQKAIAFMDEHPEAGGLGVRMLDGKGKFLPESKRGLPTPAVAFYKIFGLATLFPRSKRFGRYHLGYMDEFSTHEIEILSGAFMWMRKTTLDKVGLLDETFFMYGEDIDLSYRIVMGGYKNYYYPETRIIHYKGESTKKSSVNYVFVFYRAMVIFAEKHFSKKNARLFSFFIHLAIYLRAGLALVSRFAKKAILPVVDVTACVAVLFLLSYLWEQQGTTFPETAWRVSIPSYVLIWLLSLLYAGAYDKPIKWAKFFMGTLIGTALILILYALLPKTWQFSRLFILLGGAGCLTYFLLSRIALHVMIGKKFRINGSKNLRFAIVGSEEEANRVKLLLEQSHSKIGHVEFVSDRKEKYASAVGDSSQLDQIVHIHKIDEIIFCAKDSTAEHIIQWMSQIDSSKVNFKIAQPDSVYIIGSNSSNTSGELYVFALNAISQSKHRRNKRTLDVFLSLGLLATSPISCWLMKGKARYFSNLFSVLIGKKSFVGYHVAPSMGQGQLLPPLKKGILSPVDPHIIESKSSEYIHKLNLIYARDYSIFTDINILSKAWRKLGGK